MISVERSKPPSHDARLARSALDWRTNKVSAAITMTTHSNYGPSMVRGEILEDRLPYRAKRRGHPGKSQLGTGDLVKMVGGIRTIEDALESHGGVVFLARLQGVDGCISICKISCFHILFFFLFAEAEDDSMCFRWENMAIVQVIMVRPIYCWLAAELAVLTPCEGPRNHRVATPSFECNDTVPDSR